MVSSWNINNTNIHKELIGSLKIEKKILIKWECAHQLELENEYILYINVLKKLLLKTSIFEKKNSELNLFEYIENGNLVS